MQGRGPVGRFLPGRDRQLEDELLATIGRAARVPVGYPFADHVGARLALGDRRYGHAYLTRTVDELLTEAVAEAENLPAWALLAFQQAVRHGGDQSTLDALRQALVEAGCGAARAHERLHAAIAIWKRAVR